MVRTSRLPYRSSKRGALDFVQHRLKPICQVRFGIPNLRKEDTRPAPLREGVDMGIVVIHEHGSRMR
jgi:hypothetical protein